MDLKKGRSAARYEYIDLLRSLLCLGVLFYHLGLLKGGFFAVCGFLTLSGYFLTRSLDRDDLSLWVHYKKRFKAIYLPLIATVFSALLACSALDIFWVTMKPEVTSIVGGYNNYYQISVNADYFAASKDTPFLHLWYISLALQIELFYPLIFLCIKKLSKKLTNRPGVIDPAALSLLALTASVIYSYVSFSKKELTIAYYGTFERLFSFFFGAFAYFIGKNRSEEEKKTHVKQKKLFFFLLLALLLSSMFIFDGETPFMAELMILFSLAVFVLILLGECLGREALLRPFTFLSSISYEIYLVHYPLMIAAPAILKGSLTPAGTLAYTLMMTLIIAALLHKLLNVNKDSDPLLILLCVCLGFTTVYGGVLYALEKDHTEEMNALKEQLAAEEQVLEERQQAYLDKLKEENDKWDEVLSMYEDEDYAEKAAKKLRVCGIGDSTMLGGSSALYSVFDNFYCDAVISRPGLYVRDIMASMKANGILDSAVVIHIGSNGGLWEPQMYDIASYAKANGIQVFWLTVTNDNSYSVHCNGGIREMCAAYDNLHLIDWEVLSQGHPGWFIEDGIHLTWDGAYFYSRYIYDAVHSWYKDQYEKERQAVLDAHEEDEKGKVSFYGGELLASLRSGLIERFEKALFLSLEDPVSFSDLKARLLEDLGDNSLPKTVAVLTGEYFLTETEIKELSELLSGRELCLISLESPKDRGPGLPDSVHFIDLDLSYENDPSLFHSDRIHLNEAGIEKAASLIKEKLPDQ
jgi:peptidoglycan/LPS O-acetylase OafA/YrhL